MITAAVSLVLAVGNAVTKDRILEIAEQTKKEAQQTVLSGVGEVLPETAYEIEVAQGTSVTALTKYLTEEGKQVFAVACSPMGYGGSISMMVGVDEKLNVTGVSIMDSSKETPGLGANVGVSSFYGQFIGKTKDISVKKSSPKGNEVEAVTGATISSQAVANGVNDAVNSVGEALDK